MVGVIKEFKRAEIIMHEERKKKIEERKILNEKDSKANPMGINRNE